jgi:FAD/FMN-containing dehydrogenase
VTDSPAPPPTSPGSTASPGSTPAARAAGVLAGLRSAVGEAHVLTDAADVAAYDTDWRGAYGGRPLAVVRPGSTAEVSAVLRLTHEAGVAVVPQGGNTGMSGGAVPDDSGSQVVLSLGRMRALRDVDAVGGTPTA